jgi:hypothetical protein
VVLWRLSFRVVGGHTKAPPEFAPCTVHTNKGFAPTAALP